MRFKSMRFKYCDLRRVEMDTGSSVERTGLARLPWAQILGWAQFPTIGGVASGRAQLVDPWSRATSGGEGVSSISMAVMGKVPISIGVPIRTGPWRRSVWQLVRRGNERREVPDRDE